MYSVVCSPLSVKCHAIENTAISNVGDGSVVVVVVGRGGVDVPDSDVINSIPSVAQVNRGVVHIFATHRYN